MIVEAEITGLKERVTFLEGIVGMKGARGVVSDHSRELDWHADLLHDIKNRTENMQLDIASMKADIVGMKGDIAGVRADITDVRKEMNDRFAIVDVELEAVRSEMATGFAKVKGQMYERFATVESRIEAVQSDLGSKMDRIEAVQSDLGAKMDRILDKIGA
ncbi:hypothetical protein ACTMTI_17685 [Nonomuraea sp. H19]|uniref:hypothetical protein n=1 Tax=Nonomuraea sp. H19 TaxID=3452206 RepID=UPI003F8AE963